WTSLRRGADQDFGVRQLSEPVPRAVASVVSTTCRLGKRRSLPLAVQFAANFNDACPIIALEAVVTRDENNARAGDAHLYGVDDRLWKFHGANTQTPEGNDVLVSQALPVLDPRHQFDSEQMGQTKNRFALPVTVGDRVAGQRCRCPAP